MIDLEPLNVRRAPASSRSLRWSAANAPACRSWLRGDAQDDLALLTPRCAALERCAEVLQREDGVNLGPQLGQRYELRAARLHHEILGARGFRCDRDDAPGLVGAARERI